MLFCCVATLLLLLFATAGCDTVGRRILFSHHKFNWGVGVRVAFFLASMSRTPWFLSAPTTLSYMSSSPLQKVRTTPYCCSCCCCVHNMSLAPYVPQAGHRVGGDLRISRRLAAGHTRDKGHPREYCRCESMLVALVPRVLTYFHTYAYVSAYVFS